MDTDTEEQRWDRGCVVLDQPQRVAISRRIVLFKRRYHCDPLRLVCDAAAILPRSCNNSFPIGK